MIDENLKRYLWTGLDYERYEVIKIIPQTMNFAAIVMKSRNTTDTPWCLEYCGTGHYFDTYEELQSFSLSILRKDWRIDTMSQPCYASCFVPSNLETAHYDVISLMATPQGRPVAIMRSKTPSDYCWCILRGFSTVFFTSRSDAESYCNKHHFTDFRGGRKHE